MSDLEILERALDAAMQGALEHPSHVSLARIDQLWRFDLTTSPGGDQGKFKVKFDRTVNATINGGGVDASFSTFNGRIMIKKK